MLAGEPRTIGDFRILREIGRGGMGVVYEAEQVSLGRRVALKVLPGMAATSPEAVARFQREASAAASLSHPGIVQVYEAGQRDGLHYIAMELVEGHGLAGIIREMWRDGAADAPPTTGSGKDPTFMLDLTDIRDPNTAPATATPTGTGAGSTRRWNAQVRAGVRLVASAARAIAAAHAAGVLHRDIKPGNLLVTRAGEVKVVDFGLARSRDARTLTRTGETMGTPANMSPEQVGGARNAMDARTAVDALGATLYEVITGHPPFDSDTVQGIIHQIVSQPATRPRKINAALPRDLETICMKALEKAPADRYVSAAALADDLERFLRHEPIQARPAGPITRVIKLARRRKAMTAAVLALIVALGATWGLLRVTRNQGADLRSLDHEVRHRQARDFVQAGMVTSVLGYSSKAREHYSRAYETDLDCVEALVNRAMEHLWSLDREAAARDLDLAAGIDPTYAPLPFGRAAIERWGGEQDALAPLGDTSSLESITAPVDLDTLGFIHRAVGRPLEALDFFERSRRADPTRLTSISGLGWCSFMVGRYDDADEAYRTIGQLAPDSPMALLIRVFVAHHKALSAEGPRRHALAHEARQLVDRLLQRSGETPLTFLACSAVDSLLEEDAADRAHEPVSCSLHALEVLAVQPELIGDFPPPMVHAIAAALVSRHAPERAIEEAKKAIDEGACGELAWVAIGMAETTRGRFEEAASAFRSALRRNPFDPLSIGGLLRLHDLSGEGSFRLAEGERVAVARRLTQTLPDDPRLMELAGLILREADQLEAAEIAFRHARGRFDALGQLEDVRRLDSR